MSVQYDKRRDKYVVRWREGGRQRIRRFSTEAEARVFDDEIKRRWRAASAESASAGRLARTEEALAATKRQGGVYAYGTSSGVRWRIVFRQSDGTFTSRRGFKSRTAAVEARRQVMETIRRGEIKGSRETFAEFWDALLDEKRRYMTAGSHQDFATHGRKRLLPYLGNERLARIDEECVREWLDEMSALVDAGEISAKTVNNARTCLAVALNEATRRGLLGRNPCAGVPALPVDRSELDYLRMAEIEPYLDACSEHYRPLATFPIGTGARISEALDVRFRHVELDARVVHIYTQRAREGGGSHPTKGKRFRSVQIGPGLAEVLTKLRQARGGREVDWVFLCPTPLRGRYAGRSRQAPPHRKTVHDWHEAALVDAGLRDMPLHALRHTAAASWLTTGHPLNFVQRQLGHRSITTTEEHYGHLEMSLVKDAAVRTEQAIARATPAAHRDQAAAS